MTYRRVEEYTCDWCGSTAPADYSSQTQYYTGEPRPDDWSPYGCGHLCPSCASKRAWALDDAEKNVKTLCVAKAKEGT